MLKKYWVAGKKRLDDILAVAIKNLKTSEDQIEETTLMIAAYDVKIETFK